jgi:hypothetical protein
MGIVQQPIYGSLYVESCSTLRKPSPGVLGAETIIHKLGDGSVERIVRWSILRSLRSLRI